jgi:hypothetical protein
MRSFCDQVDKQVQALLARLQPPTPKPKDHQRRWPRCLAVQHRPGSERPYTAPRRCLRSRVAA